VQQARNAARREALSRHEHHDPVVLAAHVGDPIESLYVLREQMAREAAALLFDRLYVCPRGRDSERLSSRRIRALADVANLTAQIARADPGAPSDAIVRRVVELLLVEVASAAADVLPEGSAAKLGEALRRRLDSGALDRAISGPRRGREPAP